MSLAGGARFEVRNDIGNSRRQSRESQFQSALPWHAWPPQTRVTLPSSASFQPGEIRTSQPSSASIGWWPKTEVGLQGFEQVVGQRASTFSSTSVFLASGETTPNLSLLFWSCSSVAFQSEESTRKRSASSQRSSHRIEKERKGMNRTLIGVEAAAAAAAGAAGAAVPAAAGLVLTEGSVPIGSPNLWARARDFSLSAAVC